MKLSLLKSTCLNKSGNEIGLSTKIKWIFTKINLILHESGMEIATVKFDSITITVLSLNASAFKCP